MSYFYLTIIEKEPSSNETFTSFVLSSTGIGANFKLFTFVHIREKIRHSGTGAEHRVRLVHCGRMGTLGYVGYTGVGWIHWDSFGTQG